jgi:hypothetical protein
MPSVLMDPRGRTFATLKSKLKSLQSVEPREEFGSLTWGNNSVLSQISRDRNSKSSRAVLSRWKIVFDA